MRLCGRLAAPFGHLTTRRDRREMERPCRRRGYCGEGLGVGDLASAGDELEVEAVGQTCVPVTG